jgi:hypothetical protein
VRLGKKLERRLFPFPVKALLTKGAAFQVTPTTVIVCKGDAAEFKAVAERAVEVFHRVTGGTLKISPDPGLKGNIVLRLDRGLFPSLPDWQRSESYRRSVSAKRVRGSLRV